MEILVDIDKYLHQIHPKVDGWCSLQKATKFLDFIREEKCDLCVEIGVFGGSSLLPQALGLAHNHKGKVVGIDPWATEASLEDMQNQANIEWWSKIDYEVIYRKLLKLIFDLKLQNHVELIRDKSENVVDNFVDESVDILHIDGNHCESLAYKDSVNYLPKVKMGGYIFYDDITWQETADKISTQKGLDYLKNYCDVIDTIADCLVLRKTIRTEV